MEYGYARVSTANQSLNRQLENIKAEYPNAVIYAEAYTGRKISRPEFDKMLKKVKSGDTIIFDSVSRMSRNADEGIELYEKLFNDGVKLVFLKEPHINTDTYQESAKRQIGEISTGDADTDEFLKAVSDGINKYMISLAKKQIRLAFEQSQKEVDDLRQRTSEGMRGKNAGRRTGSKIETEKAKNCKRIIAKHSKTFGGELKDDELMILCNGIARNTFYKYKREIAEDLEAEANGAVLSWREAK